MRYPLWAFFFVLVMPVFTAHTLLAGKAELVSTDHFTVTPLQMSGSVYWHHVASR